MSRGQRYTFLAVALAIAVVAIIVLAGSGDDTSGDRSAATATPTATQTATSEPQEEQPAETPTATPTPTPAPPPLLTGGKVTKLEAKQGDTVRFRVRSAEAEEVHVHGYDISKDLEPGKTETMSFKATITGIFEIEFEHAGEQIAELRVDPN
jgi:heme/copper-type cytochrome/quinol oxidase subunit 2